MNKADLIEDVSFILYFVPLVLGGGYALVLWILEGMPGTLPTGVYLAVTKSPYVFLTSLVVICLSVLMEVYFGAREDRPARLGENSRRMQILAVICFVFSLISAWATTGFSDTVATLTTFLDGRYSIIYPLILMVVSFFVSPAIRIKMFKVSDLGEVIPIVLFFSSPLLLYYLWRLNSAWWQILSLPMIILVAGVVLSVRNYIKEH